MARFKWGDTFWQLNEEMLDRYSQCEDGPQVLAAQKEYMDAISKEKTDRQAEKKAMTGYNDGNVGSFFRRCSGADG